MSDAWLLAESFEQSHRLIGAINAISIDAKLALAGVHDRGRQAEVDDARKVLRGFLEVLGSLLPKVESDDEAPVPGQAPRVGEFLRRFVQARRKAPSSSTIFSIPIDEFIALLDATSDRERRELIDGLRMLREIIERHHHSDVSGMLGDV